MAFDTGGGYCISTVDMVGVVLIPLVLFVENRSQYEALLLELLLRFSLNHLIASEIHATNRTTREV